MKCRILIPTDGTTLSHAVVDAGIVLAHREGASIVLFAVAPTARRPLLAAAGADQESFEVDYRAAADRKLDRLLSRMGTIAQASAVPFDLCGVLSDDPAREIVDTAHRYGCNLIFMGSHERRGLSRLMHPSVTAKVKSLSDIPVTVHAVTREELFRLANRIDELMESASASTWS
jgi:nucleotide-binding universal stress UspA family protein